MFCLLSIARSWSGVSECRLQNTNKTKGQKKEWFVCSSYFGRSDRLVVRSARSLAFFHFFFFRFFFSFGFYRRVNAVCTVFTGYVCIRHRRRLKQSLRSSTMQKWLRRNCPVYIHRYLHCLLNICEQTRSTLSTQPPPPHPNRGDTRLGMAKSVDRRMAGDVSYGCILIMPSRASIPYVHCVRSPCFPSFRFIIAVFIILSLVARIGCVAYQEKHGDIFLVVIFSPFS